MSTFCLNEHAQLTFSYGTATSARPGCPVPSGMKNPIHWGVGVRLWKLGELNDLTQTSIAHAAGVAQFTISRIEQRGTKDVDQWPHQEDAEEQQAGRRDGQRQPVLVWNRQGQGTTVRRACS